MVERGTHREGYIRLVLHMVVHLFEIIFQSNEILCMPSSATVAVQTDQQLSLFQNIMIIRLILYIFTEKYHL